MADGNFAVAGKGYMGKLVGIMPGGTPTAQTGLSQDQDDISHHDSFTVAGKGVL